MAHWAHSLALPSSLPGRTPQDKHIYDEAFEAIDDALLETGAYLAVRETSPDREKERELSQLWTNASGAVAQIDPGFSGAMGNNNLGWTNPDYWNEATNKGCQISLTDIENTRAILNYRKHQIDLDLQRRYDGIRLRSTKSVVITTLVIAVVFSVVCIYGGIRLMAAPAAGETVSNFLGLQFSTNHAGLAFIALGAATFILIFRRVSK